MVHVGVDLHKRSAQLAVLMPDGELTQQRLENDPERLERFFAQVPGGLEEPLRRRDRHEALLRARFDLAHRREGVEPLELADQRRELTGTPRRRVREQAL